jgi:hypothetical protein
MQEYNDLRNPPVRDQEHSMEFLIGQHSLFLAGLGQAFFYVHQFSPYLPVWIATPLLLIPWSIVFILFYHEHAIFSPQTIRKWWCRAVIATAFFTLVAEAIWILGLMPPPTPAHKIAADILVQFLMNLGWLSVIPMVRDYKNNPYLWK